MKVALLTSAAPEFYQGLSFSEKRFPIGVGYLISVLEQAGHSVEFVDRYLLGANAWPKEKRYDYIGIYSNTPCFEDTNAIIRELHGRGRIMVGGPHTSYCPESIPKEVDFICEGEGERVILDIVGRNGESSLTGQKLRVHTAPRLTSKELDELPSPPFKLFMQLPYELSVQWFSDKPVFNFSTSRGCNQKCSFCAVPQIWGRKVAVMRAERIVEDIEKCIADFGVKGIYFREDNFAVSKARVQRFCDILLRKKIQIKWCCETRVDTVDRKLLSLMARAGCKVLYVGFESGSDKMLKIYNKAITVSQSEKFASAAHAAGVMIAASMIFGHPEETDVDRALSQKFVREIKPKTVWWNRWRQRYETP